MQKLNQFVIYDNFTQNTLSFVANTWHKYTMIMFKMRAKPLRYNLFTNNEKLELLTKNSAQLGTLY